MRSRLNERKIEKQAIHVEMERNEFVLFQVEMFEKILSMIHQTLFTPITTQILHFFSNFPTYLAKLLGHKNFHQGQK